MTGVLASGCIGPVQAPTGSLPESVARSLLVKTVVFRPLSVADVEDYRAIRLSALKTAPDAFGSVHALETSKPIEEHAERLGTSLVIGAYHEGQIVGMAGFRREVGPKDNHKGFVWGFFVEPDQRGRGVGSALMSALLRAARTVVEQVTLSVVEENTAAIALYRQFGFVRYGVEPRALKHIAGYSNEVLMVLILDGSEPFRDASTPSLHRT